MSTPLVVDIEASLACELDGQALAIHASQGVIVINVKTPELARALIAKIRRFGKMRSSVARLNAALLKESLRLELHVDEVIVASMGHRTNSGFLLLAGLPHVRAWPLRFLQWSKPS